MAAKEGIDDPSLIEGDDDVDGVDQPADKDSDTGDGAAARADDIEIEIVGEEEKAEGEGDDAAADAADEDRAPPPPREDDTREYSVKVRERIAREQSARRSAEDRAKASHEARVAAEREAVAAQQEALETTEAALGVQIQALKAALVKAKDDGKTSDEVELQSKLAAKERQLENVGAGKESLKQKAERLKAGGQDNAPNPLAQEWVRTNSSWFGSPRFKEQSQIVRVIDAALASDGWDKNTPEYFEELDRRIRRRLPEMQKYMAAPAKRAKADQRQAPKKESVGSVQRRDGAADGGALGKRKVRLDRADFENMRNFGLDPNSREHQLEYARNKLGGAS